MVYDPNKRITAQEALSHPYFLSVRQDLANFYAGATDCVVVSERSMWTPEDDKENGTWAGELPCALTPLEQSRVNAYCAGEHGVTKCFTYVEMLALYAKYTYTEVCFLSKLPGRIANSAVNCTLAQKLPACDLRVLLFPVCLPVPLPSIEHVVAPQSGLLVWGPARRTQHSWAICNAATDRATLLEVCCVNLGSPHSLSL